MIRYLRHSEINKDQWDSAIDQSFNGMVYAKSWYLDIVSPEWEALIKDDYQLVFPLTQRRKFGIRYLYQPFFTQQLGIFSIEKTLSEETVKEFLDNIPPAFKLIEIQLNQFNQFNSPKFKIRSLFNHLLDLNQPYEKIKDRFSNNLNRNLKKAHENNLELTSEFNTTSLIELFKKNRGKDVRTLKEKDYIMFEKIVSEASKRNLISKLGITMNNALEAGALFLKSTNESGFRKGEYIFLFSATSARAKEAGAMSEIIDAFIQSHSAENMKLDFEGSMDKGLARFYKSFGAVEVVYLQIRKNSLPLPLRWLK